MNLYQVHAKYPCGFELDILVSPGAPMMWPNKELPTPDGEGVRAIKTMADACEYVSRTCAHQTSPVDFEWPASVDAVKTVDAAKTNTPASMKALLGTPKKAGEQ